MGETVAAIYSWIMLMIQLSPLHHEPPTHVDRLPVTNLQERVRPPPYFFAAAVPGFSRCPPNSKRMAESSLS
jgi:hypothetical protein